MTEETGDGATEFGLSMDTLLTLMADKYRRRLLVSLLEQNPLDDDDIHQLPDDSLDGEELASARIRMTHVNLPKLAAAGVTEWDQEANVVRRGPAFGEVRPLLELLRDNAGAFPDDWI